MTTTNTAIDQDPAGSRPFKNTKKQQDLFHHAPSMDNTLPDTLVSGTPALSWADIPDIPEPWELLESPQVWLNGESILDNLNKTYNTTPTCDFQSNVSSTDSPLLGDVDDFNTSFGNADFSLHQLIPPANINSCNFPVTGTQDQVATRSSTGTRSINAAPRHPSSPAHTPRSNAFISTHAEVSCRSPLNAPNNLSPRHTTVGSDTPSSQDSDEERLAEKRRRNKLAARKLRQKKLDQVSELEAQLEEVKKERDALRLRAAKSEGELMVLRKMIDQKGAV